MLPKIAIVTPCFRESQATLDRMLDSVLGQTEPCLHVLVSDGVQRELSAQRFEQYARRGHRLVLLSLPFRVKNSGAAPRAVGAAWAFTQGYDYVSFLDADNAITKDHVSQLHKAANPAVKAIVSERRVFLKDTGEETPREPAEQTGEHIDTNCLTLSASQCQLLGVWAYWPVQFGTGEDRIFSAILNSRPGEVARTGKATVLYSSEWPIHYQLAGKPVPSTARRPSRRAATHFHAASFFEVVGPQKIAKKWQSIKSEPLPTPENDPLLTVILVARHLESELCERQFFSELVLANSSEQSSKFNVNTPVFTAPDRSPLTFLIASAAVLAHHQGRSTFISHVFENGICGDLVDAAIRKNVGASPPTGLALYFWTDQASKTGFSIAAPSHLGALWTTLLTQAVAHSTNSRILDELVIACQRHNVSVSRFKIHPK